MKVKEFLSVLEGGIPTVRIIDANVPRQNVTNQNEGIMYCDYLDSLEMFRSRWKPFEDCEVLHFRTTHEVSHKRYKELGLIPPYRPDLTAEYHFGDLKQKTYYDIYIDGATAADGWQNLESSKAAMD